jgi:hypothetical protein
MTQCIPRAVGVPGLIFRPPVWRGIEQPGDTVWKSEPPTPSTSQPPGLDDPRWQGGLRIGHPEAVGGAEAATFRAVWSDTGGKALYLSWHVRVDPTADADLDVIWVGLERAAGDPIVIKVQPFSDLVTKLSQPISALEVYTLNSGADTVTRWPGSPPDWIMANTRMWFQHYNTSPNPTNRWAVQMRVPVNAADPNLGVNLADTFRMWYEMTVCPASTCLPHRFPRQASVVTETGFPAVLHVPPLSQSQWESFHLSTGAGDPVCPTTGFVSLNIADIGTSNVPTSRIDPIAQNIFEAKPLNKTLNPIPTGAISAFFRIANWGSIADPNAPWDAVPTDVPNANPATNTAVINVNDKGLNTFTWTLTPAQRDLFKPPIGTGTKDPHQCVLVELSGAGIVFQPASTWTNMNIRSASRLAQVAEINTVGLGPGPGGSPERDTYLLVEKLNMPAPGGRNGEGGGGGEPGGDDGRPPGPDIRRADDHGNGDGGEGGGDENGDDDGRDPDEALEEAAKAALTEDQRRDAIMATYRVHVYHDTGETVVRDGVTLACLTPGTSFGHWVSHDGPLAGWRDDIQGATRIAPSVYRLRAPAEGVVQVVTVVEAVERPGGLLGWLRWLLEWLLRLLRRLLRLLRRRP